MNISELLKIIMQSHKLALCCGFYDYLFSDNFGEEPGTWSIYNTYFKTENVEKIVVTNESVEIVLK